ncbi:MAG: hypothetical protein JO270_10415 [Acidobacteriaceae bacterium]|nr:hypothetical protein [Acidobacteriaceae bacterium]
MQKFSRAKLVLFVGLMVQASARSLADLISTLTGVAPGALVGAAARVGEAQVTAKQTIRMNHIVHLRSHYT